MGDLMRSKYSITSFLIIILITILFNNLYAQDPPIKWGKVPMSDLEMKTYPGDTAASAAILCDYGETYFDNNLHIIYKRQERVKIFNKKGYEYGSFEIELYTGEDKEHVHNIEGITYSLDKNGSVIKKELADNDIFKDEKNDDYTYYKFTMPDLKPGCIVDVSYEIESEYLTSLRGWEFQREIPERWSEYRIRHPKQISYQVITRGYENWAVYENKDVKQVFWEPADYYLGSGDVPCEQIRLAVKDAPALKDEPFITTMDDYVNKVDVQLYGYSLVNTGVHYVLKDWKSVINNLLDNSYFGDKIDDTHRVTKLAEQLTKNLTSPKDKMVAIYNWVANSIVWTGKNRLFADQDVNDILDSKNGNSAEITFLLLSMLKSIGIESYPVILSTRSNGRIQEKYPILDQFNYVIAKVVLGSKSYFLDATNPFRPFDFLPEKVLNVVGLVVKKDTTEWIGLKSKKRYRDSTVVVVKVAEDGNLTGEFRDIYSGYASIGIRQTIKGNNNFPEIAKDNFDADRNGFSIDSVNINNQNSILAPLIITAYVHSNNYVQTSGDMIYLNPQVVNRKFENVFKDKERKFPVDFSFPSSVSTFINVQIPEGFEIKDNINDTTLVFGNRDLYFVRIVQVVGNYIQIKMQNVRNCTIVDPDNYSDLRKYYDRIVSVEAEQLVLKKIKTAKTPETISQSADNSKIEHPKHITAKSKGK